MKLPFIDSDLLYRGAR